MKSLNTKRALSAFGIVAILTSPAFAQKRHHVVPANQPAVYNVIPGYDESAGYGMMPGYDRSGGVVDIQHPDRYAAPSRR
jgi:hypothetical protein